MEVIGIFTISELCLVTTVVCYWFCSKGDI